MRFGTSMKIVSNERVLPRSIELGSRLPVDSFVVATASRGIRISSNSFSRGPAFLLATRRNPFEDNVKKLTAAVRKPKKLDELVVSPRLAAVPSTPINKVNQRFAINEDNDDNRSAVKPLVYKKQSMKSTKQSGKFGSERVMSQLPTGSPMTSMLGLS